MNIIQCLILQLFLIRISSINSNTTVKDLSGSAESFTVFTALHWVGCWTARISDFVLWSKTLQWSHWRWIVLNPLPSQYFSCQKCEISCVCFTVRSVFYGAGAFCVNLLGVNLISTETLLNADVSLQISNEPFVPLSSHSRTVPAASGAAGPDAETAAGADPAATESQQHQHCQQHTGQYLVLSSGRRSWSRLSPSFLSDLWPSPPLSSQGLANTLDQASAQFAASALVTADQLLALKTKEELGPGGGVNGVLSPSGTTFPQTSSSRSLSSKRSLFLTVNCH